MEDIPYKIKDEILRIITAKNKIYTTHELIINFYCSDISLGTYNCVYTTLTQNNKTIIEDPTIDLSYKFYCTAPEAWSICIAPILNIKHDIAHKFNFYKQLKPLGNKQLIKSITITNKEILYENK